MQAGYIAMSGKKSLHREDGEYAPLAYADTSKEADDGMLLIGRGATIFPTYESAEKALRDTLKKAEAAGHEWPRKKEYAIVQVRYPLDATANAEVRGERLRESRSTDGFGGL